ncbi:MAG: NACHT domain-containing protein [Bacteroidia bacterium]|nr:NACHT domain-containing protein [Bacteroidia bacterium]
MSISKAFEPLWPEITGSLIDFVISKTFKAASKQIRFVKFIQKLGLPVEMNKESFDSVYIHSLLDMDIMWEEPKIMLLFADKDVRLFFERNYRLAQHEGNTQFDQEQFTNWLFIHFTTSNERFGGIPFKYHNEEALKKLIESFTIKFQEKVDNSLSPGMLKLYNELTRQNKQIADLLDQNRKNTFDYQIQEQLAYSRERFQEKYIDTDHYIPIAGHKRKYKDFEKITKQKALSKEVSENDLKPFEKKIYEPIDSFVSNWIDNSEENILVILGEYGTGKTTFSEYLTHQLAHNHLEIDRENQIFQCYKQPIPFYFTLRDFEESMDGFILKQLNNKAIKDLSLDRFKEKLNSGEFLLILDGFDEMTQEIDSSKKRTNYLKIKGLISSHSKSKIILTVRQEYFSSDKERWNTFLVEQEKDLPFLHLNSFNDKQIRQYLKSHDKNPEERWRQIQKIPGLKDLASRPVLLQIIIDHLEGAIKNKKDQESIKATDLYEEAITSELDRKDTEIPFKISQGERIEILEKLSAWMHMNDTLYFEVPLLEDELELKSYFDIKREWEYQKYLNEFLTFSFLINEGNERFRISHKSFRDYLTARKFVKEINNKELDYFSRTKLTEELNVFIRGLNPQKGKLLELIKESNKKDKYKWMGSNAANILLKMDPDILAGEDLSHAYLPNVDFIFADLRKCNLKHATITNARVNRSILDAEIEGIDIEGGEFYPLFKEPKNWDLAEKWAKAKHYTRGGYSNVIRPPIFDLTKLGELNGLKLLDLRRAAHEFTLDISPISNLQNLESLDLSFTEVLDISPLSELYNLKHLDIRFLDADKKTRKQGSGVTITLVDDVYIDLSFLSKMEQLQYLNLYNTKVKNFSTLSKLKNLRHLELEPSLDAYLYRLRDLSPLSGLIHLEYLNLNSIEVEDLSPLSELKQLKELHLVYSSVKDLSPLSNLQELETIYLGNTSDIDLTPLLKLKKLNYVDPGKDRLNYDHIQMLLEKRITVSGFLPLKKYWAK